MVFCYSSPKDGTADMVQFQHLHGGSKPCISPIPENLISFDWPAWVPVHMWCTYIYPNMHTLILRFILLHVCECVPVRSPRTGVVNHHMSTKNQTKIGSSLRITKVLNH